MSKNTKTFVATALLMPNMNSIFESLDEVKSRLKANEKTLNKAMKLINVMIKNNK